VATGKYHQKAKLVATGSGTAKLKLKYKNKKYSCKVTVKEPEWKITEYASVTGRQAMCYTVEDYKGDLIIIDGGWTADADNLRDIIEKHGNHVTAWIITHPHPDHVGAFNVIAANPGEVVIDSIYTVDVHRGRYQETAHDYDGYDNYEAFFQLTQNSSKLHYLYENNELDILGLHMKVLHTWDADTDVLEATLCNNGGLCFTLSGKQQKMLFCADVQKETEKFILERHLSDLADVTYLQAGHHGNWGMTTDFYQHMTPSLVFFDSTDALLTPGEMGYDAGVLKAYFEARGIPVYNFSTAPNQIILR
jgi:beta-lactamase superfamily II metal-dependent hydrolase